MKQIQLLPRFVEFIPEELEDGILYVSMEYRTTAHLCCCGCGNAVYLPLNPTQWRITFDGDSVWLEPSVGSWSLPCRSHYWIRANRILWAEQWTTDRVEQSRALGQSSRDNYFASPLPPSSSPTVSPMPTTNPRTGIWAKFKAFWGV